MTDPDFHQLLERLLDGEENDAGLADEIPFEELSDAQAEELVAHLSLIPALRDALMGEDAFVSLMDAETGEDFVDDVMAQWERGARAKVWHTYLPWAVTLAACLSAFLVWAGFFRGNPGVGDSTMALLVDEAGATFAEGAAPDEVRFGQGVYELESGAMHLRFTNGADMIMRAPARFRIENALRVQLESGGLRAIVPESAHGFTVGSPGIDYEDLGTEFGVSVDPASGRSEMHVFDGQVNVRQPKAGELVSSIRFGESVAFDGEALSEGPAPDLSKFPTPGSIGFERWKVHAAEIEQSDGVIAFFPFQKGSDSEVLENQLTSRVSPGRIVGARWVTGRWPGKEALLFDRDTDYVELSFEGAFEELTLTMWVKVDRLDHEVNALLDSNSWEDGDLHWQLKRQGLPWVGVKEWTQERLLETPPAALGEWMHLTAQISRPLGIARVYKNGGLVYDARTIAAVPLTPGVCRIGNWLRDPEWPHAPVRALRGRIDEFAAWDRVLTPKEIEQLVEQGKPTRLWSVTP